MTATVNPFRANAERARASYEKLSGVTARDAGMAQAFPLGAGYGRPGAAKRIDRSIARAVKAVEARKRADYLAAQADAFDAGRIDWQGRRTDAITCARSDKRASAKERRDAKIAAAKSQCEGKEPWAISPETWADAHGYLAGSGRALVMADHAERVAFLNGNREG